MKKYLAILSFTIFLLMMGGCGNENAQDSTGKEDISKPDLKADANNTDPLLIEIKDMEARSKKDTILDRNVGLRLLKAYQNYYNMHPNDSLGIAYLFEAARVADAMGKYEKATELLVNFHDRVANVEKKAEAMYMLAFVYDAHLHNPTKAIKYYGDVIQYYPNSPWATQAKSAIPLVGKSDEDLIKMFEEKNKGAM
jgi:tetratricopeptide (TPR) repeat protein